MYPSNFISAIKNIEYHLEKVYRNIGYTLNTYVFTCISVSFNSVDCLGQIRGGDW